MYTFKAGDKVLLHSPMTSGPDYIPGVIARITHKTISEESIYYFKADKYFAFLHRCDDTMEDGHGWFAQGDQLILITDNTLVDYKKEQICIKIRYLEEKFKNRHNPKPF